ncbi:MAG: Hsp33 family molecular chaperone HslO [Lachnospiraceae bacterium]|nr:Hsp33 family molecular chaperone HslO [Lachnospiraceae bacterium]
MNTHDHIVRATAANGSIRAFASTTVNTVETARAAHDTSPVVTAALGRTLTAGAIMAAMMKGADDLLTIQLRGSGPMKGITVSAGSPDQETGMVSVKGYATVPEVIIGARSEITAEGEIRKLDVGSAIGTGTLSVIRDLGLKDPYIGQVELQTGEVAEDLAYYFAVSEQVPSAVGLGVLMERNNTVRAAGGFIIQMMPDADESVISALENRLSALPSVTTILDGGSTPKELLATVLDGFDVEYNDELPVRFYCNCDRERVEKVLISLGPAELDDMIKDGRDIELKCRFCAKPYQFPIDDLKKIRQEMG